MDDPLDLDKLTGQGPPVSMTFFCGALDALCKAAGNRLLGKGNEADEIRRHLGEAEKIYRTLPEVKDTPKDRADDLDRFADGVENIRREAHDFGLEAFPKEFWESCEEIERALRAEADRVRENPASTAEES